MTDRPDTEVFQEKIKWVSRTSITVYKNLIARGCPWEVAVTVLTQDAYNQIHSTKHYLTKPNKRVD